MDLSEVEKQLVVLTTQRKEENTLISPTNSNNTQNIEEISHQYALFDKQKNYIQSYDVQALQFINQKSDHSSYIFDYDYEISPSQTLKSSQTQKNIEQKQYDNTIEYQIKKHNQKQQLTENKNSNNNNQVNKQNSFQEINGELNSSSNESSQSDKQDDIDESNIDSERQNKYKTTNNIDYDKKKLSIAEQYKQKLVNKMFKNHHTINNNHNNNKDSLLIVPRIKKFYYSKTLSGKTSQLTYRMRSIIGDKSDKQFIMSKDSYCKQLTLSIIYILDRLAYKLRLYKIPIFNPENIFKIIFNIVIMIFSCSYLFLVTLKLFFSADLGEYDSKIHSLAETAWVLEMMVQMNTAMYHDNKFTKDRRIIMNIYLKEYFFFEILPLIFDNLKSENQIINIFLKLPLLLKMKGITINLQNLEFYILQMLDNHVVLFLIKLILSLILYSHFLSCSFNSVNQVSVYFLHENTLWTALYKKNMDLHDWPKQYLLSLNWALNTMLNNQHIAPESKTEYTFMCICMIISCIGFGYLISSIGSLLGEIDKEQKQFKQDLNILNQYMKRKQIDIGLVRRVNVHLQKYYEQKRRVNYIQERNTLGKLNEYMLKELQIQANYKILQQFPLFSSLFSDQTNMKICMIMQEKLYSPNQVIYDDNNHHADKGDTFIYLIVKGQDL